MNSKTMKHIQGVLRDLMAEMLSRCTAPQRDLFHRMYNYKGEHARDVDGVRANHLDNAFSQIEKTLVKNDQMRRAPAKPKEKQ